MLCRVVPLDECQQKTRLARAATPTCLCPNEDVSTRGACCGAQAVQEINPDERVNYRIPPGALSPIHYRAIQRIYGGRPLALARPARQWEAS